jgi:putative transposase
MSRPKLSRCLTGLKRQPDHSWLRAANAQSLQQALDDLHRTYAGFFQKRTNLPRFKSKRRDTPRFRIPQCVRLVDGKVYVPKIGWIRIRASKAIDGNTRSATFKRDPIGHWYVIFVVEFPTPSIAKIVSEENVVGIDLGLEHFVVTSDGSKVGNPRFFRQGERQIRLAHRRLDRRKPGSRRRAKAKHRLLKLYRNVVNKRKDFSHKLSTSIVKAHEGICVETISVDGLARTKLAKSISDAALGDFREQLLYKSRWFGKASAAVDRWYPSSKKCSACSAINQELTLEDRTWKCRCGVQHDRDINAAVNIRFEGLRLLTAGHAESLNARGLNVRLPLVEATGDEA